jgi:hypothetical protein
LAGLVSISAPVAELMTLRFIIGLFWRPFSGLPRKCSGPPLLELSFQVDRENTHNQLRGCRPRSQVFNARGPSRLLTLLPLVKLAGDENRGEGHA